MPPTGTTPLNTGALHFRWRQHVYDLSYDERHLTVTWSNRCYSGTTKTPLWRVMEAFVTDRQPSERALAIARSSRWALAAGVIVWFSQVRAVLPLLAPALLLFGMVGFVRCARLLYPVRCTRVLTRYGEELAAIPHLPALENSRVRFEEGLLAAVRASSEDEAAG
ncbi:MAG: hypothetical protein JO295_03580 [Verrucomicrobia bacterium]|nr:hypothetical protein [Verrucomicrobiota bacterium]